MSKAEDFIRRTVGDNIVGRGLVHILNNKDILLALGILVIISLLIIPLSPILMDLLIATNLSLAVLILLVSLYLKNPLEFSAFPTILLVTTLFRLGLNVATTRLILTDAYAGEIIQSFGTFVIRGNYIVGLIIFIILMVINFIVIIKGSSRIAEVAARFTLDALPGKQMSIDADLNAGYIDEQEARIRRQNLTKEADFYGAMDGAAKFIRGDAIAGLIITGINIIGGFAIGVAQRGMTLTDALSTYTILTIGDGLVSQIPSLLISVAAGFVVTRSSSAEKLDIELGRQIGGKPTAISLASFAMFIMAFIPGFPTIPFLILSSLTGALAYLRYRQVKKEEEEKLRQELVQAEVPQKVEEQPIEDLLKVDPVELELGYNLIPLVDETQGGDVFRRIMNVRKQLALELGIILPPVRVRDNLNLEPEEYVIKIRGNEVGRNTLQPGMLLAMNPGTAMGEISGIHVTEPVFGLPAVWISYAERENAELMGYSVVEASTVLITHLTELLKRNADKLLTRQEVKKLIDNLQSDYPALVEEITPENLPLSVIQKVLQNLLKEGIPIKDLPIILESLLEYYKVTKNVEVLTEYVRHNLSETIKRLYQDQNGVIHCIALSPEIEQMISNVLQTNVQATSMQTLGLSVETIKKIQESLSKAIDDITLMGYLPLVICSAQIRPYFYRMVRTQFPMISVISYTELPPDTEIDIVATISV
ncbi:MAG: Flagellar biosynthesis protein FlhA [Candidatus Kapaibacterium sp.]|jgi:flagellar biosynthesis protein FlhA|nr:MAG: Flagellar biosynthesis protein FlhA [Candidatus Kapabacteria bacterium]ROL56401.1 MAG: flagellar biosynthesis protein FlhA [Bacteroidetes/Chlorobi group bacterium Naka2016]